MSVWSVCWDGRLVSADASIGDPSTKVFLKFFALLAYTEPTLLISLVFTVEILQIGASRF